VSGLATSISTPVQTSKYISLLSTFNSTPLSGFESDVPYDANTLAQILALSQIERYQLPMHVWTTPMGSMCCCSLKLQTTPSLYRFP
jgi:hypothetical protein